MEKRKKNKSRRSVLRRALELTGAILLLAIIVRERAVFFDAWQQMKDSDLSIYIFALLFFWTTYAWSAIGYKVLASKAKLKDIMLVNLAASGAGKVIPGGAGFLSFGTMYLHNKGYKTEHALAMATTNNTIGFLVNFAVLCLIALTQKDIFQNVTFTLSTRNIMLSVVLIFTMVSLILFVFPKVRNAVGRFIKSFGATLRSLFASPHKLLLICVGSLGVLTTNALVLYFSAHSVGLELSYPQAIIGMSFGVAIGSLLPTPGGVGGVEAGLIATLVLLGFDTSAATAAALLYRLATYIQPFVPGVITYLYLRKKRLL